MLLSSLLLATLLVHPSTTARGGLSNVEGQAPAQTATFNAAVQLAEEGRNDEALRAFQRLVSTSPNDHQARVWIGRLHMRMGNPALAEPVFRSVMIEDPMNVEATYRLGLALLELERVEESIDILERAATLAPTSADVLGQLAHAHTLAGHRTMAAMTAQRAFDASPNPVTQVALQRAEMAAHHRVELAYAREDFSGSTPASNIGDLKVDFGMNDALRLFGVVQVQDKFDETETRLGGGLAWTYQGATTFSVQVIAGIDDPVVMPEADYNAELTHSYRRFTGSFGVRHFEFSLVPMTTVSPAIGWQATDTLWFGLRYAFSHTGGVVDQDGHTGQLRAEWQWHPRAVVLAGISLGVDDFDHLSIDRVGDFKATTGAAGVRLHVRRLTSVTVRFEYQDRRDGPSMGRATISLTQGF